MHLAPECPVAWALGGRLSPGGWTGINTSPREWSQQTAASACFLQKKSIFQPSLGDDTAMVCETAAQSTLSRLGKPVPCSAPGPSYRGSWTCWCCTTVRPSDSITQTRLQASCMSGRGARLSRLELADWLAECKGSMNQWSPPPALFNVCDSVPPTLPAPALALAPPLCRASPKGI
jgi:hypothetical protein